MSIYTIWNRTKLEKKRAEMDLRKLIPLKFKTEAKNVKTEANTEIKKV